MRTECRRSFGVATTSGTRRLSAATNQTAVKSPIILPARPLELRLFSPNFPIAVVRCDEATPEVARAALVRALFRQAMLSRKSPTGKWVRRGRRAVQRSLVSP
jgi:hypothetical protein